MKETVYIRKKSQVFQAYDVNLHVVYRNSKAITEYDYILDLQTIEKHDEEVRKETAREILKSMLNKMYKLTGCGVPYHVRKFIEEVATEYGVELFGNSDRVGGE